MLPLYYSPLYSAAIDDRARFPKERYDKVHEALCRSALLDHIALHQSTRLATRQELELVHDPEYVEAFLQGDLSPKQIREIGFRPWTPQFVTRTLTLTGASISALERVLTGEVTMAGNLAGGTHHAFRGHGEGYCVFNDLAICAEIALGAGMKKVLVLDLDVHQGNGTARIFEGDPRVFTVSFHGQKNYPTRKQSSDLDVAFEDGTQDEEYLVAVESMLKEVMYAQRPDLVLYQAGVDALKEDALGRLAMTREGLARRNAMVFDYVWSYWEVPMVVFMGGGYAKPIERSVEAHQDLFEEAARRVASLG